MKKFAVLAMEAIQFQKPVFFDELVLSLKEMRALPIAQFNERVRDYEMRLAAIIKHHTDSNVTVSLGNAAPRCAIWDGYANHALTRQADRDVVAEHSKFIKRYIQDYDKGRYSLVDINTGKLSGLFSELPYTIYFPVFQVSCLNSGPYGLDVEEVAAMFLHEVGHYYTYCEYFSRTVKTNQALSAISKAMDGSYEVQQRELHIAEVGSRLHLKGLNAKALAAINDKNVVEIAIMTEVAMQSRSEMGISIYDETACEFLSDQYAVRMGAGRYMLTGLDKIHRAYGIDPAYQSTPAFMWSQFAQIAFGVMLPPVMILFIWGGTIQANSHVYDDPESRFRRIKQEMTAQLKNRQLPDEDKKRLVEEIRIVEEVMESVCHRRSVWQTIIELVGPLYRKNRQSMMLQKQLETLAHNSLYVSAAELTTLQQTTPPKE